MRSALEAFQRDLLEQQIGIQDAMIGPSPTNGFSYSAAKAAAARDVAALRPLLADQPGLHGEVERVVALVARWQRNVAEPKLALAATGMPAREIQQRVAKRTPSFRYIVSSLNVLNADLAALADEARTQVTSASDTLLALLVLASFATIVSGAAALLLIRRWVNRPILTLRDGISLVAEGDLEHRIVSSGPPELVDMANDVEAMRKRLVQELALLDDARVQIAHQAEELRRSNSDLEQFAYVASHDLQEPLRKVASFCELLERRYGEVLDERGRQYVALAADGARRMQALIADVLALARIGRRDERLEPTEVGDALDQAKHNLATAITETGAEIEAGRLPRVEAEPSLLVALLQNLIENSLKFRSAGPPRIKLTCTSEGDHWRFALADNGIGIDPAYAERVFAIFQRLHGRSEYPGTGIGLALCRRIVEFHGGRIWVDTSVSSGATFIWTWPKATTNPERSEVGEHAATDG